MAEKKKPTDWVEIERDYRTSPMTGRELATWYGITEGAIRKKAKELSWVREHPKFSTQVNCVPEAPRKIYEGTILTPENTTPEAIVGRGRNLVFRMMDELEAVTCRQGELDALIANSTEDSEQRQALAQAVSLKQRSDVLKSLATAAKTLAETGVATGPQGKKAERQAAAEKIAEPRANKFAPPSAPNQIQ